MALTSDLESPEPEPPQTDDGFVWDVNTQLYYHSNTGFYYDPQAEWYYSSRDGHYYKFENGNYILIHSDQVDVSQRGTSDSTGPNVAFQNEQYTCPHYPNEESSSLVEFYDETAGTNSVKNSEDHKGGIENELPENPPPSEWYVLKRHSYLNALILGMTGLFYNLTILPSMDFNIRLEDTLIDLYLSNYPNQSTHAISDTTVPEDNNGLLDGLNVSAAGSDDMNELEEGEWVPDDHLLSSCSNENALDEGTSLEEENWQAQYGQVTRPDEDSLLSDIHVINLWDWSLVKRRRKEKKHKVAVLVGRLAKRSIKLHPSMPSSGGLLRTAPICEVHLDLVRVKSGNIYRLRNPSSQYLASLSNYDSSNPTKDWCFPQILMDRLVRTDTTSSQGCDSKAPAGVVGQKDISLSSEQISAFNKSRGHVYRDRAAERRALHNGIGVGPGQKSSFDSGPNTSTSVSPEEAMAESLNASFGTGSYARRVLESMGWKEGEALGSSNKGLIEPLQAKGNMGNAGLGWDHRGRRSS
ncbi:unnamed protein product [Cuscuta epithymum]|uniref:G-patch domain-containing protein n=1 Tax=Cuscuta epithymum TaxID=186058 RepID=A0AAV0EXD8_9ASTE|nr:unnamed protein product [Cuscuta epithymum]